MQSADRITKMQLIILIPDTWSAERAARRSGVTKYQKRQEK